MTEIVLKVPDDLPLPGLIARLNDLIAEEHLKWMLFTKSVDELAVDNEDMAQLENIRVQTWKETRKKFDL
ncbi:MAG: hypothetical protein Q7T80_01400 [Methanoregula sp.]|nr:hypothetical protein [Methanoregula sp.]